LNSIQDTDSLLIIKHPVELTATPGFFPIISLDEVTRDSMKLYSPQGPISLTLPIY